MDDANVRWLSDKGYWEVSWKWRSGTEPTCAVRSGLGEYPRHLTLEQEELFEQDVEPWIENQWMVPHDPDTHGAIGAVLPLLSVAQEHKTTPVRPCLDYRPINALLRSKPGAKASVYDETLRDWRQQGQENSVLDIRKAYPQVLVHPTLLHYRAVIWKGKAFVMERMGFGLSIAPKVMDSIVKWVTRDYPSVGNYVDDLFVPCEHVSDVELLSRYGWPTKPAEALSTARVLGLQLHSHPSGSVHWKRREGVSILSGELTRRSVVFAASFLHSPVDLPPLVHSLFASPA